MTRKDCLSLILIVIVVILMALILRRNQARADPGMSPLPWPIWDKSCSTFRMCDPTPVAPLGGDTRVHVYLPLVTN